MREQKRRNFTFDIEAALGHSLGEYTALVSAGVLDFSEGVLLVHKRGRFMEEVQNGGMVAILGLGSEDVGDIVKNIEGVEIANLNCPGQIVIAGENLSLKEAEIESKKRGARLTLKLKVSIPSHSSYMKGAKEKLREEVKKIEFKSPSFPVVPNYLALPMRDSSPLKEAIIEQMTNPVRWEESVQKLIDSGVETFIEIGPGKVLSGLVKRVNRDTECLRVSDLKSMEETIRALNET
ncbi:MAG TPA: ACP S-malonyltransferase [Candidatus Omnitrophica bacterium]|nr:ACP S-malonyltransferase [Candidatus Omnitrophota bacterium]